MYEEQRIEELEGALAAIHTRGWTRRTQEDEQGRVCALGANRAGQGMNPLNESEVLPIDRELARVVPFRYKAGMSLACVVVYILAKWECRDDIEWAGGSLTTVTIAGFNDVPWRRQRQIERAYRKAIRRLKYRKLLKLLGQRMYVMAVHKLEKRQPEVPMVTIPVEELDVEPLEPVEIPVMSEQEA
jgi:hypothetical protein